MKGTQELTMDTTTPTEGRAVPGITRRGFVKLGRALFVSVVIPKAITTFGAETGASLDPTQIASWLEIRSDNTIVARTGRTETGTGMSAYYAQTLAEELNVRPETISLILGDTDRTPDGGYSAGFLSGAANLRKVGAYTHQALLELAAKQWGVPVASLSVTDGIVSSGGRNISYGQLVAGQHLELKIPIEGKLAHPDSSEWAGFGGLDGFTVTGEPSRKPVKDYKVVGTSHPMPGIPDKVTGKTKWSCDVELPGMVHARMVRPATLGATLISAGAVDKTLFPRAEVVHRGNLVAVVSPNEWEAISAARAVAANTKWTEWSGLPGSENLTKTIRANKWDKPFSTKGKAET